MSRNSRVLWHVLFACVCPGAVAVKAVAETPPAIISYQGRISVGGTNVDGVAQFKFALVDRGTDVSSPAAGEASLIGQSVASVNVTVCGAGYSTAPSVSFEGGGGDGAQAYAMIAGGAVLSIVVTNGGSNYLMAPTVLIDPPPREMHYTTYWSNDGTGDGEPSVAVLLSVTRGLFSVMLGDTNVANMAAIPARVFTNADVRVRTWFDDGGGFKDLEPVQRIGAAAYALRAAGVAEGTITADMLAAGAVSNSTLGEGAVTGDKIAAGAIANLHVGIGVLSGNRIANGTITSNSLADKAVQARHVADEAVGAAQLTPAVLSNTFWRLNGNAGTTPGSQFLGTEDNLAFEIRANGRSALRIEPETDAPRIIGGESGNAAAGPGSTVAGGGSVVFGPNRALGNYSTVGGGTWNTVEFGGVHGTIAGGYANSVQAGSERSVVSGGSQNQIGTNATDSAVGGGWHNTLEEGSVYDVIGGGLQNSIRSGAARSAIAGGERNSIGTNASHGFIGGGSGNEIAAGTGHAMIGGGDDNTVMGGSSHGAIVGGSGNRVGANTDCAVVAGGSGNEASADHALAAGHRAKAVTRGSFVWADSTESDFSSTSADQYLVRAAGGVGINTSSPAGMLHVSAGTAGDALVVIEADPDNNNGADHPMLELRQAGGSVLGQFGYDESGGATDHNLKIRNLNGADTVLVTGLPAEPRELARFANDGDVGIGTNNPGAHRLYVTSAGGGAPGATVYAMNSNTNSGIAMSLDANAPDCVLLITQHRSGGNLIHGDSYVGGWHRTFVVGVEGDVTCRTLTITGGSDVAEPFDVTGKDGIEPGMVLAIDPANPGKLKLADKPYEKRAAGIVSGAGGVNPGVLMNQAARTMETVLVALTGRVYVRADASAAPIEPGDMLTTSDTPGHAMKATDPVKAHGATIGKAMTPLAGGRGLVLVLVNLQ